MTTNKLSLYKIIFILILASILFRIIIYYLYGNDLYANKYLIREDYLNFISNKLTLILDLINTKPIGFYITENFFVNISKSLDIEYIKVRFLTLNILHAISIVMLLLILIKIFNINKIFSLIILTIYSFSLVVFEYWRLSSHFDHFNIFFIISLIYFSLFIIKDGFTLVNSFFVSLTIFLFNFFYSLALLPIITSLVFISLSLFSKKSNKKEIFLFSIILLFSILSHILTIENNFKKFSIPLSSTVQGQNSLQFSISNKFISSKELLNFIDSGKYPNWYKECAKNAHNKYKDYESIIYGECVFLPDKVYRLGSYDLSFLSSISDSLPEKLKLLVYNDISNIKNHEYILRNFGIFESNLNLSVEYGKISKKVSRDLKFNYPINSFLNNYLRTIKYLVFDGAFFFNGKTYEPQLIKLPSLNFLIGQIIGVFLLLGSIFSIIYFIKFIFNHAINILKNKEIDFENFFKRREDKFQFYIIFTLILLLFALSITTCCENSRMFATISPLSLITFCFIYKKVRNYLFK